MSAAGLWPSAGTWAAEGQAVKPPPLKVDKGAPLLLDEPPPPEKNGKKKGKVADNSACFVCHGNYEEESLATVHAKEDIGCVKCHGESLDHRGDEDNITPPEKMYAASDIEKACQECHETHDAPARKVVAMWQQKCPARTSPGELLCTDCHGEHRLKFRTVWWDKKTGKLGERKPGEKFRPNPDLTKVPGRPEPPPSGDAGEMK
jgi:hypothetical protein